MYQNIYYEKNNRMLHIWDDKHGYIRKDYRPYAYKKASNGKYITIYGNKARKLTGRTLYNYFKHKPEELFESDVEPRTRYLIDNYTDSIEPSEQNFCFYDIEVYSEDESFPDVDKSDKPINAITFYLSKFEKYFTFLLDPDNQVGNVKKKTFSVYSFKTEKKLLKKAVDFIRNAKITVLTGWYSWDFDDPYFFNRIQKVLGESYLNRLSPINLYYYNQYRKRWYFAGFTSLDYLKLYKNFTYTEKPSYSLNFIAKDEIKKHKIIYKGSLNKLWKNDRKKFVRYNIEDVRLMVEIEKKKNYLNLAIQISHIGHIPYENVLQSTKIIDGAILTYLKQKKIVAPSIQETRKESYVGAYVKPTKVGRYEWIYDLDFSSLYPSILCTLNISPETKVGKITGWEIFDENDEVELYDKKMSKSKMKEFLKENEYSISSDGKIYEMKRKGIVPIVIQEWLDIRSNFKNLRQKYEKKDNKELRDKYDKMQHAYKILANSLYGVMGNEYFRFYDIDNASAITTTGQQVIKYAEKIVNEYYNKEIGNEKEKDYVIAIDTDSVDYNSIVETNKYGKIKIGHLFEKLNKENLLNIVDLEGKKYIFPKKLKSKTYDDNNKQIIEDEIEYIMKHEVEKEMFKIELENGKSVIITSDHSIEIINKNGDLIEKKPQELNEDDICISL